MKNDWMLDVLADLRSFADLNDMPRLSRELARVSCVARDEIQTEAVVVEGTSRDEGACGTLSGSVVASENA